MQIITYDQVKEKIFEIRNQKVILDSDVAELYGVETKRINEAVKNNPNKFPIGYLIALNDDEWTSLRSQFAISSLKTSAADDTVKSNDFKQTEVRSKISASPLGGGRAYKPKAFTERGLYMLATILKSPKAIATTIAIIDTFAQIKALTQSVYQFAKAEDNDQRVKIFGDSTEIVSDLLCNNLIVNQFESGFKIKLPFIEISRKVTKLKK